MVDIPYFSPRNSQRIARVVRDYEQRGFGKRTPSGERHAIASAPGVWVRNVSGEEIPAYSLVGLGDATANDTVGLIVEAHKPGTTFYRQYMATGRETIGIGETVKLLYHDAYRIAYDSGTPAAGEGWGPKPGQWSLAKGYPVGVLVLGVVDSTNKVLLGTLSPITSLIGKTTAAHTAGDVDDNYNILTGRVGDDTNAGFTTVPDAEFTVDMVSGEFIELSCPNGLWLAKPLLCAP